MIVLVDDVMQFKSTGRKVYVTGQQKRFIFYVTKNASCKSLRFCIFIKIRKAL